MSGDERSEEEEEEEEEETNDEEDVEQRNDLELVRENAVDSQRLQGKPIGDKAHIDPTAFLKGSSVGGSGPGGGKRVQQFADISSAFAGEDVVGEFEEEKEQVVEKSKPKDVDLTLPGMRIRACISNVQYAQKKTCPRVGGLQQVLYVYIARVCELLLKIMAVLAKVGTLRELPSVLVDPCLYYCCTAHQALAALRSLCTEGCAKTVQST